MIKPNKAKTQNIIKILKIFKKIRKNNKKCDIFVRFLQKSDWNLNFLYKL